tara:strand:+ start:30 stop:854 length:825 start_codon:yes stop_codon:yes gene_type:complete
MPELPEVETVAQSIKKHLIGIKFDSLTLNWKKTLHNFTPADFKNKLQGKSISNIYRRGKYIIIDLDGQLLAVHLRMTGKLYVAKKDEYKRKHVSLYLKFKDNYLVFEDTRKFGRFYLYKNLDHLNQKLGVEPLSIDFTKDFLFNGMKQRKRQIKAFLLDQSFVVGLGNIYVDEALWHAKIHPLSTSNEISKKKIYKLHEGIVKVLKESIKLGGTTIRDYTYDFAYAGNYALNLAVFNKQGTPCLDCRATILKIKVAQRGTHFCPVCQNLQIETQ